MWVKKVAHISFPGFGRSQSRENSDCLWSRCLDIFGVSPAFGEHSAEPVRPPVRRPAIALRYTC